jgi:hypothetical protein
MEPSGIFACVLAFAVFWVVLTSMINWSAGWFTLMLRYPNRRERAVMRLRGQSGLMGARRVRFGSALRFDVCPSGLRVGMFRLGGVFARDFFVPWDDLSVEREVVRFTKAAVLTFGGDGELVIRDDVANRLARAAGDNWPEVGPFPRESVGRVFAGVAVQLALVVATLVALYFTLPGLKDIVASWPVPPGSALALVIGAFVLASLPGLVSRLRY